MAKAWEEDDDIFGLVTAFDDNEVPGALEKDAVVSTDGEVEGAHSSESEEGSDTEELAHGRITNGFLDLTARRGLTMRCELRGSEDHPKLLYIPGATDDLRKSFTISHLNAFAQSFYTLTCDLRNQGETTPVNVDNNVNQETHVEDLIALVDATFGPDETFHVVGWSSGAVLALALARAYPLRVGRLVVLSGGYISPKTSDLQTLPKPAATEQGAQASEVVFGSDQHWVRDISSYATMSVEERCRRMLVHADRRRESSAYRERTSFDTTLEMYVRSELLSVMRSPMELGRGVVATMTACFGQGTPGVEGIRTPTLIVQGRHDGMIELSRAEELRNRMPAAELKMLEDQGHVLVFAAVQCVREFTSRDRVLPSLSLNRALAMLDELNKAFKKSSFQKKLSAAAAEAAAAAGKEASFIPSEVMEEQLAARGWTDNRTWLQKNTWLQKVCLPVQIPIVEVYGFEPTLEGVRASEAVLAKLSDNTLVQDGLNRIQTLLKVDFQTIEPQVVPETTAMFADLMETRGIQMRYDLRGPENAPKLLYIPGITDDLRKPLTTGNSGAFSGQFRVLTCDLRNQGLTNPFDLDRYVPIQTYLDDLIALMDLIWGPDSTAHVVGWSFGSVLALSLAKTHQHRVMGLVLLAAGYWEPQPTKLAFAPRAGLIPNHTEIFGNEWQWVRDVSSYTTLGLAERCRRSLYYADTRRQDSGFRDNMQGASFEAMMKMFERSENDSVMKRLEEVENLGLGVLAQESSVFLEGTPGVEDIRRHTMIVNGRHDGMHTVDRAKELKDKMPSAILEIIEDCGHAVVRDAAAKAIPFLVRQGKKPQLRRSRATALLDEMTATLRTEEFQKKFRARRDLQGPAGHARRRQLFESRQGPILERYGFEPTLLGLEDCWENLRGLADRFHDLEMATRIARLEALQTRSDETRSRAFTFP